jgi:hypothetical protein
LALLARERVVVVVVEMKVVVREVRVVVGEVRVGGEVMVGAGVVVAGVGGVGGVAGVGGVGGVAGVVAVVAVVGGGGGGPLMSSITIGTVPWRPSTVTLYQVPSFPHRWKG